MNWYFEDMQYDDGSGFIGPRKDSWWRRKTQALARWLEEHLP